MDKQKLIQDAGQLGPFDPDVAEEYFRISEDLVKKLNTRLTKRSDLPDILGGASVDLMKDNHANHTRFISSILKEFNPEVLTETILWVFRAYRSRGFTSTYWAVQLNAWINILQEDLSEKSFAQIFPLYEWMQVNIPLFEKITSDTFLEKGIEPSEGHKKTYE